MKYLLGFFIEYSNLLKLEHSAMFQLPHKVSYQTQ